MAAKKSKPKKASGGIVGRPALFRPKVDRALPIKLTEEGWSILESARSDISYSDYFDGMLRLHGRSTPVERIRKIS